MFLFSHFLFFFFPSPLKKAPREQYVSIIVILRETNEFFWKAIKIFWKFAVLFFLYLNEKSWKVYFCFLNRSGNFEKLWLFVNISVPPFLIQVKNFVKLVHHLLLQIKWQSELYFFSRRISISLIQWKSFSFWIE